MEFESRLSLDTTYGGECGILMKLGLREAFFSA